MTVYNNTASYTVNLNADRQQTSPYITPISNGRLLYTWSERLSPEFGVFKGNIDVKGRIFSYSGETLGGDFTINDGKQDRQFNGQAISLSNGGFMALWEDKNEYGDGYLYARIFNSSGIPASNPFLISNFPSYTSPSSISLTTLSDGRIVATWEQNHQAPGAGAGGIVGQIFTSDGQISGENFRINQFFGDGYSQGAAEVTALSNGNFVVAWETIGTNSDGDHYAVLAKIFNVNGQAISGEFFANTTTQGMQRFPEITSTSNGGFLVTWTGTAPDGYTVNYQLFDGSGNKVGTEKFLSLGWYSNAASLTNGDFVITYTHGTVLYYQIIDSNGNLNGVPTKISEYYFSGQGGHTVTPIVGGGFVVTYEIAAEVYSKTFTPEGGPILDGAVIIGTDGADTISQTKSTAGLPLATSKSDMLSTGAGNDRLDGGQGADFMQGGSGNDTYIVDNAGDIAMEKIGEGTDLVMSSVNFSLGANVENLTLTGTSSINGSGNSLDNVITGNSANNVLSGGDGNDSLNGGAGNDTLIGGAGNDRLVGGLGADTMSGGLGDDSYTVDDVGDVVTENADEGTDTVSASISYTLGANLEKLTLTGANDLTGTGNNLANTITGNTGNNQLYGLGGNDVLTGAEGNDTLDGGDGNDTLNGDNGQDTLIGGAGNDKLVGGLGADSMSGGLGDDGYTVDDIGDVVIENANEGTDTVSASVGYTLGANLEKLTLTGTDNLTGTGNDLANTITGNAGSNQLYGLGGNDVLTGGDGNDFLYGGTGNDTLSAGNGVDWLSGGLGADTLSGGTGADTFSFDLFDPTTKDTIKDFEHGIDHIALDRTAFSAFSGSAAGTLNASNFVLGTKANTADQRLIYNQATGALYYDADGSGSGVAIQIATLTTKPTLDAGDFVLI
ncbi:calcium-binding protein [Novosphingobium umbonatum]|nr:calcium-binding protein [Novosphingobium umbonatum]